MCSPEEPLPGWEVGSLEERVFEDALDPAQRLDHVCAVVVQVPQLAVMALVGPPEGVLLQHLVLLEVRAHPPALVVRQRVPILLEQRVDSGDTAVPRVLQIFESQPSETTNRCNQLKIITFYTEKKFKVYKRDERLKGYLFSLE